MFGGAYKIWVNAPLPANIPVIHGALITESLTQKSIIRDGSLIETRETQKVISLVDGIDSFDYSSNEQSEIVSAEGCEVETRKINSGVKFIIKFPKPLTRGQSHQIGFVELSPEQGNNGKKAIAMEIARAFSFPTYKYNLEVIFIGRKPKLVWSYSMLTMFERPGKPDKRNIIEFKNDGSSIIKSFDHLHGGLFSGIAWEW